ncbi:DUF3306 domain-containing protein [Roseivivax sp. CAU 1761]
MSRGDFWSRRKARVAAEEEAALRAEEDARAEARADALEERSDAEILAEFGLPDPDNLKPGDMVAGFLRKEIPERLRRRALRALWRSNPVLACLDGLNDYDGDYTNAATDAPGVKTAYQVGRGLTRHVEEMARQKSLAENPEAVPADADAVAALSEEPREPAENVSHDCHPGAEETANSENPAEGGEKMQDEAVAAPASTTKVAVAPHHSAGTVMNTPPAVSRRMRFRFDTES